MMKKLFSIAIALLMLLSGMQLTFSRHYCGGELADSKVSLIGHIASCGMEGELDECPQQGNHLESSCCNNKISVYTVDRNYSPTYTELKVFSPIVLQVFTIPENSNLYLLTPSFHHYTDDSPPGLLAINEVSLPKICVFRI